MGNCLDNIRVDFVTISGGSIIEDEIFKANLKEVNGSINVDITQIADYSGELTISGAVIYEESEESEEPCFSFEKTVTAPTTYCDLFNPQIKYYDSPCNAFNPRIIIKEYGS